MKVFDIASSYSFGWVEDGDPRWDAERDGVFRTVSQEMFPASLRVPGRRLPGTWWRLVDGGTAVAHGWLHVVSGRAVALLAVDEAALGSGASGFGVIRMGAEVGSRGFGRVVEMRRREHPDCTAVTVWVLEHASASSDGGRPSSGERPRPT